MGALSDIATIVQAITSIYCAVNDIACWAWGESDERSYTEIRESKPLRQYTAKELEWHGDLSWHGDTSWPKRY